MRGRLIFPSVIARNEAIPDCADHNYCLMSRMVSLIAARAYLFFASCLFSKVLKRASPYCLDTKETKNQVSRKASSPHKAIALQIRQNLGCYIFTLLSLCTCLCPSVKICYALPLRTRPPSFCLLSPEAVLLTGRRRTGEKKKRRP